MKADTSRPGAALLDVDGTLIDSNGAHASAWSDALAEFGYVVPAERIRPLIGMGGDKLLPRVTGVSAESSAGIGISERRTEIFKQSYLPAIKPFPGVRSLLERMRREGLKLVVATSATDDELGGLLDVAGIEDLLDGATSSSDAEESKPDPDIVEAAMARTGCESSRIVMLGDTPYDVEAARRAGIRIVAVRCGGWGDADLKGAAAVYDDPAGLLARFDESPFAVSDLPRSLMHPIREARLRPEFAEFYPGLEPGVWYPAATIAELLVTQARTLSGPDEQSGRRLSTEHFEFRGGSPPGSGRGAHRASG